MGLLWIISTRAGMYDKELYLPLEEAVGRVFEPPVKR